MGRRAEDRRPRLNTVWALGSAALIAAAACGGEESGPGDPADGALFAVGPEAQWKLLSAPRDGGEPRLTDFTGAGGGFSRRTSTSLPAAARVHRLGDRHLALLTPDGAVIRYDPVRDLTSAAGRIGPGARWTAHDRWGVFRDTVSGELLQLAPGGAWTYRPEPAAIWASPARDGSVVAIVSPDGGGDGALLRFDRAGNEPVARLTGSFAPVAAVTGFGGQVAAARRVDDGWELILASLPELRPAARASLPAAPDALASSPSGHELYVAVGERLLVFGRPSLDRRAERSLPGHASEIRPGFLGGPLLVRAGGGAFLLPWDREDGTALDTEWRSDLPLSLPDGSVLAVRSGRIHRIRPGDDDASPPGEADRWWIPVRWSAPSTELAEGARPGLDRESGGPAPARAAAGGRADSARTAAGTGTAAAASEIDRRQDEPEPGFYAVVAAARSPDGIRRLLGELSGAGWPTAMQEWRDDAGDSWFRGLVGPYPTRPEAERTARRLQRERDVSVWVKELGPGISGRP